MRKKDIFEWLCIYAICGAVISVCLVFVVRMNEKLQEPIIVEKKVPFIDLADPEVFKKLEAVANTLGHKLVEKSESQRHIYFQQGYMEGLKH